MKQREHRAVRRDWTAALVAVLLSIAAAAFAPAANAQATEYQIKVAFLCKFGNFVEWPPRPGAVADTGFVIGVVASDEVLDQLARAARGQTVNGRPIAVRRFSHGEPIHAFSIIFVARTHASHLADTLSAAKGQPVLTVAESDQGTAAGAMVNFAVVDDKVRFDIALQPAELSSLKISARLLSVARTVTRGSS